jgi:hypothetical protein
MRSTRRPASVTSWQERPQCSKWPSGAGWGKNCAHALSRGPSQARGVDQSSGEPPATTYTVRTLSLDLASGVTRIRRTRVAREASDSPSKPLAKHRRRVPLNPVLTCSCDSAGGGNPLRGKCHPVAFPSALDRGREAPAKCEAEPPPRALGPRDFEPCEMSEHNGTEADGPAQPVIRGGLK